MKKRDFKAFFKDVNKFSYSGLDQKGKRVSDNNTGKLKLPYKMLQGMNKKSLERKDKREFDDKQGRVVGESSRNKKLMQNYFEKKEHQRKEDKRLRLDTSQRGMNMHQMSLGKYKNGTLYFSKSALERLDKGDLLGGAYKGAGVIDPKDSDEKIRFGKVKKEKKTHSYAEIMKERESNADYMTGKRYKKSRGAMGKIHQKGKKTKKKFKK